MQRITKEVGKFGVVGVFNTLFDFFVLNILSLVLGIPKIPANLISTSLAMIISFELNLRFVFRQSGSARFRQAALFLLVTAFGLYVLQSGVIYLFTVAWTTPLIRVYDIINAYVPFSEDFVVLNGAKAIATLVSLMWNFVLYKTVVFPDEE